MRLAGLFALASLAALVLQTTLARALPLGELMPDLTLILAVELGLRHQGATAVLLAFVIGYATDAFSGSQLGLNALLYTIIFTAVRWLSDLIYSRGAVTGMIAVFAGVLFSDLGNYYLSTHLAPSMPLGSLVPIALLQAAISALCAPAVFRLMMRMARLIGLRPRTQR